ncbi:hypothetical protein EMIHUDRAFT_217946 [Emiliania huxleyi CCMP1516]|uniref:Photosystem I reaction center subunit II n=2 Tax=Emiliania huxleyi TaxID=2903 RepID=A0A0D3I9K6_EMIH1|nr:hypothetical protein EMIHUDRAFT_217946 [Emiliania huxleyi CCMP1516]EOD07941.1 hypothetical protein EMIHUDRAFT_217946 [Emiliania huxleyi CCMP1516]|eukprot:XP_005760370.1 hypothetical protein EMIHUDRAFT_217946 [Emiliania huxleyi CCMP1516]
MASHRIGARVAGLSPAQLCAIIEAQAGASDAALRVAEEHAARLVEQPEWVLSEVLLSPDLAPHILAQLPTKEHAAKGTLSESSRNPALHLQIGGPPLFVLMWFTPMPFVYESLYGGAEMCELGRHTVRLSTKQQALTLGSKMRKGNAAVTYSVYKLGDGEMRLLGSYPKGVNADGTFPEEGAKDGRRA